MKVLALILAVAISSTFSFSQNEVCDCKTDLDFVVEKMMKMPSYKKQMKKGDTESKFKTKYKELSDKMNQPIATNACFLLLNEMMNTVNDNHAKVLDVVSHFSVDDIKNEEKIEAFKSSHIFKNHPKTNRNIEQLKIDLAQKTFGEIEGIYYSENDTYGIYQYDDDNYEAVLLETAHPLWQAGQVVMHIEKDTDGRLKIARYNSITRKMSYAKSMTHINGRIWNLKRDTTLVDHTLAPKENSNWEFKQINDSIQYFYFGSFSNRKENVEAFKSFYEEVKDKVTASHLLVDLRSNTGGNSNYSDPFVKLMKQSKAKVYILTNDYTGSNGEQMTLKLRKLKHSVHLGLPTFGIIAYGINYGNTYPTPSGLFKVMPTDMNFHHLIEYENKGIRPHIELSSNKNWVDQVLELIQKDSQL